MARDKSFEERRRDREREEEKENGGESGDQSLAQRRGAFSGGGIMNARATVSAGNGSTEKLIELFQRAEPMIEQVNNLYNQYLAGIERRPPLERRQHLELLMQTLQTMNKPSPAYQFRYTTLNASFLTHRDRWDRLIKELEAGKLKRQAGGQR